MRPRFAGHAAATATSGARPGVRVASRPGVERRPGATWAVVAGLATLAVLVVLVVLGLGACTQDKAERRARSHAADKLGVTAAELRVWKLTELSTSKHQVFLVTGPRQPPQEGLTVVVGPDDVTDARTPGAFDAIARAENAAARVGKLGPERVVLWWVFLDGKGCPPSPRDGKFARVTRPADGGLELRYTFQLRQGTTTLQQTCRIELAPDGSLRSAQPEGEPTPLPKDPWDRS